MLQNPMGSAIWPGPRRKRDQNLAVHSSLTIARYGCAAYGGIAGWSEVFREFPSRVGEVHSTFDGSCNRNAAITNSPNAIARRFRQVVQSQTPIQAWSLN